MLRKSFGIGSAILLYPDDGARRSDQRELLRDGVAEIEPGAWKIAFVARERVQFARPSLSRLGGYEIAVIVQDSLDTGLGTLDSPDSSC